MKQLFAPKKMPKSCKKLGNGENNYGEASKEELMERLRQCESHIKQLKAIIAKTSHLKTDKCRPDKNEKPFNFSRYNKRHIALKLLYLGWDYQGYAVQDEWPKTIEAALFDALIKTRLIESRETSNYHRCGRTDKGVSALGQVISLDVRSTAVEGRGVTAHVAASLAGPNKPEIQYDLVLNKVLPPELRVLTWAPVDHEFSARFDCIEREYRYYFPRGGLNIQLMREAASLLIGVHDFRNLCKMDVGNGVINYIRSISRAHIRQLPFGTDDNHGYEKMELCISGKAFLWHQIRCIVSILFLVGEGKEKPEVITELLDVDQHPRKPQYSLAADFPLVLFDCQYEGIDWVYNEEVHRNNIRHFQQLWSKYAIQTTMVRSALLYMETMGGTRTASRVVGEDGEQSAEKNEGTAASALQWENVTCQCEALMLGNRTKTHKPLFQRETCASLTDKINHFVKRRRIEDPAKKKDGIDDEANLGDLSVYEQPL